MSTFIILRAFLGHPLSNDTVHERHGIAIEYTTLLIGLKWAQIFFTTFAFDISRIYHHIKHLEHERLRTPTFCVTQIVLNLRMIRYLTTGGFHPSDDWTID